MPAERNMMRCAAFFSVFFSVPSWVKQGAIIATHGENWSLPKLQSSELGQMSIHSLVSVSLVCAWELEEGKAAGDIPISIAVFG